MVQGWMRQVVVGVVMFACCASLHAQMLAGPWVVESEQRIDEARKTDLRVIVFGANGKPAAGVEVKIEQTRSFFPLGVVLPGADSQADWPEKIGTDEELWRCVNAISLERITDWPDLQPATGESLNYDFATRIDKVLEKADAHRLFVRWGSLVSADAGRVPPWVAPLEGKALADSVENYVEQVWDRYSGRVDQYDAYTETLGHNMLDSRTGMTAVRRLYEALPAKSDGAVAVAAFDDGLSFERVQLMQKQLTKLQQAFVPVGAVAVSQRFSGTIERGALERMLSRLDPIKHPIVISSLAVGGDSDLNAAINLETVLRTLMERPNISGIWFSEVSPSEAIDRTTVLLDEEGQLTPAGRVVDSLFYELWQTHVQTKTDELGNVRLRAFPGDYVITATLRDGTVLQSVLRLEKSVDPRVVLMEPGKK